ncbi:hypothetical protein BGW36DRAFT_389505 [Talaromyces proteolyticus]|uniref:Xylanolytic transcriptional activator xlnR n=1 Tax=Talaromyces proteolyticus TaxID=1131652 RepID=A0AAD4KJT7_9EURO|nr:uncharacterized protein BGW36DRAFT_389505 [Talaromyces proteolyticus]KAH8690872.1 hypothetical protein BGW36DRAFT_389505 [Talaromyces proteolyticus]
MVMELSWQAQVNQRGRLLGNSSRKRTAKACDGCFRSRTRCDGKSPCGHCADRGRSCRYTRLSKKRGRIPLSQKIANGASSLQSSTDDTPSEERSELPDVVQAWPSTSTATRSLSSAVVDDQAAHRLPENARGSSISEAGALCSPFFNQLDGANLPHSQSRGNRIHYNLAEDVEQTTYSLQQSPNDPYPPRISRSNISVRSTTDNAEVSPNSRIASSWDGSSSACRYSCLEPLLPYISDIVSPSLACDLLDVYFIEPRTSIFSCASSYVLVPIIRKKSLLRLSNPRPTTRALLCTMLWCASQSADIATLHMPGSRSWISNHLFEVVTALIADRDPDRLRRVPDGLRVENTRLVYYGTEKSQLATPIVTNEPAGEIDDVLTFTLLSIAISGGDFKSDSLKWWNKAVRLAFALGFNIEDKLDDPSSSSFPSVHESYKAGKPVNLLLETEVKEERRRVFWLLYCLDRHLAISFNLVLKIPDEVCSVFVPLPDSTWENLDTTALDSLPPRVPGPLTVIQGTCFFEYFLPLMAILGDIIDLHHRRNHPRFGGLNESQEVTVVLDLLHKCGASLVKMARNSHITYSSALEAYAVNLGDLPTPISGSLETLPADLQGSHPPKAMVRTQLVIAYSTHILHVLYVLLYGKWDVICMLDCEDDWITSSRFVEAASHAISASHALSEILKLDPDLTFMPYLFGIYLLHGSFILLLFADRMPQLGANDSVEEACETIIRAHEICVVTLSTEFQRNFRKVLRSTMNSVRGFTVDREEESRARRKALSLYRWTKGARGLCL